MIRIWVVVVLFSTICVTKCNNVQRHIQVQGVQIGDPVTLYCVFSNQVYNQGNMFWFKQITGEIPQVVARMQKFQPRPELYKEFNNSHLNVERAEADGIYRLTIPKMEPTDEAIYYCASRTDYEVNLINGTFLVLKGKNHQRSDYKTVVERPMSDPFHPGDSVTLQCTVLSETCTGEHSVYWFRAGSGESHPGVIYTSGNRSDECEKSPETPSPTQSCVYSLSKNNLGPSDAGTYYCAVATCGEILLGNGIKLDMATDTKCNESEKAMVAVVVGLAVALVLCGIGIIFLACTRSKEQVCDNCKAVDACRGGRHDGLRGEQDQDGDTLNYAALNFSERKNKRGRKKRESPQESVYSDVRCSDWE
ncbi:uncharacterized protein isoform X1 [Salmo salar]|uniref:Uncharacterized protein isoform X1 n=1 Tax=Salmo salar TaxID=8030 RepID=A0ABM3EWC0_SALSA|nr:uncharacterized protein LOC106604496 isoform X1 [Salmo salar]